MKTVITGENGYISRNLKESLKKNNIDALCLSFREGAKGVNLSCTEVVIHCAAIVHKKEKKYKDLYDKVNHIEAVRLAEKAKQSGVKHFIFISTMSVYGTKEGIINKDTPCKPTTLYGKSKLNAEKGIIALQDNSFKVTVLRPPMVYGENCPGNFKLLKKLALKTPVFPKVNNKRSMIYIDNLTNAIYRIIINNIYGIVLLADKEYINTSRMVKKIAEVKNKKLYLSRALGKIAELMPFSIFKKVFGSLYYDKDIIMSCDYVNFDSAVKKSINNTEAK